MIACFPVVLSRLVTFLALLLTAATVFARPQETAPRVEAEVVRVDVVVTDPEGKVVRDLTQQDFEVREDGKPQRIQHFVLAGQSAAGLAPQPEAPTPGTPTGASVSAGPGRHIVIVFDDLHVSESSLPYARDALLRFVREFTSADDTVALLRTSVGGVLQQLTQDRAALERAVSSLNSRDVAVGRDRGAMMSAGEAELVMRGQFDAITLVGSTLMAGQGTGVVAPTGPRSAVAGASSSEQTGPGAVGDIASLSQREFYEKESQRLAAPVLAEALHFTSATLLTLDQIVRQLVALPGRKICLLVSDGFYLGRGTDQDRTRDMQRVIDAATRSGAVVYTLDSRGLTGGEWREAGVRSADAPPGLQQSVGSQSQQLLRENLSALADGTGGFAVKGTNDLESGLRRILADNDAYYLLSYEPANTKRDGRFRKIEVRLAGHPGLVVRTRRGYYAPDDKAPDRTAAATSFYLLDEAEARTALGSPAPQGGVAVQLAAAYVDLPPVGSQALVGAHVDLERLDWRKEGKRERATLEIVGGIYDAAGQPVGSAFGKKADLDLSTDEAKRAHASGLEFQQTMPLPPGSYEVRLLARDAERRTLGGARERIDIPDLADKKLALSSVFLSSSSPTEAGARDASRAGTESRSAQTRRRFKRDNELTFQVYVYNPVVDEKGATDVVLQAQMRANGQLLGASKPLPVAFQEKDGVPVPQTNGMSLGGLPPGPCELRVVVVDRNANVTAFRDIGFTIE
jgi:VWFA-related protein